MRFVSVRKRLHFGMGPESGSASLSRSCDESREELLERLDVHPLLEHLQFLVKFPTHLDRCGHGDERGGDDETGAANEPAEHASTPGLSEIQDRNETGDHHNETAEHDDHGTSCEPNEVGDHAGMDDSDTNETKDD